MATDKRLDQVSTLTDFDYALIVKGDQVAKASKQQLAELVGNLLYGATNAGSLATVVAGRMDTNKLFPFMYKGQISDLNNAVEPGYYITGFNSANSPSYYCSVMVIETGVYITQYAKELTARGKLYIRTCVSDVKTWSEWDRIDNFGYNSLAELSAGIDSARPANNSKSFSVSDSVEVDTGITKMGLYRWGFDKLEYANPMYFIVTASNGVTVLNQTWFSDNVTFRMGYGTLYFTYGAKATVYLTYLG